MTTPIQDTNTHATDAHGVRAPGNRLPDESHLGSVQLDGADIGRSIAYYRDVLGFRVTNEETAGDGRKASLAAHGDDTTLFLLHERRGAHAVPRTGRLGLYHFAILLPDRAALGRFVVHLAAHHVPAGMSDHLVSEAIYLRDPDGLGIEVYADRPRDSWRWTAGELAMTTEPLDVDDLIAAAGNVPWTGMPAGTTVGHVHLHVGDLPTAADFYHAALGLDAVVWR
jgi:catechol 2,3-dioxygenase